MQHVLMADDLVLDIRPGTAFEQSDLEIGVPRSYVDEMVETLREAGLAAEEPISHSSGDSAGVRITVAFLKAGGLAAVATALAAILARHDSKRLLLDGERVDATGYTAKELERILRARYPDGRQQADPTSRE
ncbi:hypothetical protein ASG95_07300 [Phycicoccus sp. Soil803]|nr:hypothetical protein ASG95_07300 [Phycicoccus sp. Soil803]